VSKRVVERDPVVRFGVAIRHTVGSELQSIGIDDAESFADRLGVIPGVARTFLAKSSWSVEEASWIVQKLGLPIRFDVVKSGLKD